jgi:hypothetical protein
MKAYIQLNLALGRILFGQRKRWEFDSEGIVENI